MTQLISLLLNIIPTIVGEALQLILDFFSAAIPSHRKTEFDADFIPARNILASSEEGFCLTGDMSLSIEESFSNAIVFASSGAGKSSCVLIPSILKMAGASSLVIHDPSIELRNLTHGALSRMKNQKIKVLNYSTPSVSEKYNPLKRATSISDIHKISKLIVHNALGQGKEIFWNASAEALISLFAWYLVKYVSIEYRTLHNVLHLVNTFSGGGADKVDKLFVKTHDEVLLAEYKAFVAYGDRTLMNIVATARAALAIFSDPNVAQVTSSDTIDFEKFYEERTALFINNNVKDMRYYSVISAIFFEQFFGEIMSRIPTKEELPIFFLLDEASSLYLGGSLPGAISNIRKYRSGILQIYQHYHQLIDLYGNAQARNIAANCYAKVYLSGQPIEVAQELEATLGKFQFVDDENIQRTRPLMTADEIRQSKDALILCGNHPPIKTKMKPYYKQPKLKKLTEIPPIETVHTSELVNPPLIQLDNSETA